MALTTQGIGRVSASSAASGSAYSSIRQAGVGTPAASIIRLAAALSMAMPEARWPEPV